MENITQGPESSSNVIQGRFGVIQGGKCTETPPDSNASQRASNRFPLPEGMPDDAMIAVPARIALALMMFLEVVSDHQSNSNDSRK